MSIQSIVGRFLGNRTKARIRTVQAAISFVKTGGIIADRTCNICGYAGPFYAFGVNLRRDAGCPQCHSLERHRLFAIWLKEHRSEIEGKSILHFAPEQSITKLVAPMASRYVSADLFDSRASRRIDIENIGMNGEFDVVIASHVLEHVNDAKALRSIHAALKQNGLLLAMFPVTENMKTFEDDTITEMSDRELWFGQYDHVRCFGNDSDDRIRSAGFKLTRFTPEEPLISRHSLVRGETLFVCRKA